MPTPSRPFLALALAGAAALPSCGHCLWVTTRPGEAQLQGGRMVDLVVEERQFGALEHEDDTPLVPGLLGGLLLDWVDTVWAPVQGVRAIVSDDYAIEGGFLGWLAAFATPFASLTPGMMGPNPRATAVERAQLDALATATGEEREALLRALFPNPRVVDAAVK